MRRRSAWTAFLALWAAAAVIAAAPSAPRTAFSSSPSPATAARVATPARVSPAQAAPANRTPTIDAMLAGARAAAVRTAPVGPSLLAVALVSVGGAILVRRVRRRR